MPSIQRRDRQGNQSAAAPALINVLGDLLEFTGWDFVFHGVKFRRYFSGLEPVAADARIHWKGSRLYAKQPHSLRGLRG